VNKSLVRVIDGVCVLDIFGGEAEKERCASRNLRVISESDL
jgi:hypothetical protein